MKNLIIALVLSASLLVFGSFVVTRSIEAQTTADVLPALLALPAPPPPNPLMKNDSRERPESFYSKNNPPPDSAPIEDLLDYWKKQSEQFRTLGYNIKLSGRSLDRILGELENDPKKATEFLNVLPDTPEAAEAIKRIYDATASSEAEDEDYHKNLLKNWLKYHSSYFADELASEAESVGDTSVGYVTNQGELLALARIDWNRAKPIIDRLYNDSSQPVSKALARWALYRHALDTDSLGDIERYRDELKADVENKSASDGLRDLALDALVQEKDWSGRDEWYFGLLEDETLADLRVGGSSYTGLTTLMLYAPPEKYVDKMIQLVKSDNPAVRNAAVRNLGTMLDEKNVEVVRALLPWLEDKKWAKEIGGERQRIIAALANLEIPESVPGLIALLDEKDTREVADYSAMSNMSNVMRMNTNAMSNTATNMKSVEYFPFRGAAIQALAKQKSIQAVPALRRILPTADQYERGSIVRAIYLSNGFSISEQTEALEAAAQGVKNEIEAEIAQKKDRIAEAQKESNDDSEFETSEPDTIVMTAPSNANVSANYSAAQQRPITGAEIKELLGQQIIANPEPSAPLLSAVVQRITVLDKTNPLLANALRRIMLGWQGAAVNLVMLNDLKTGKADINTIIKLLSIRKELKEKQINDVYAVRSGGTSIALGVSACLLETQSEYNALLVTENAEAKAAMFGCARMIRAALPVNIVAQNLSSPNKLLAFAAGQYLESEDSPQARAIILEKYPNQAKILGATTYFGENADVPNDTIMTALFHSVSNLPAYISQYDLFYSADGKIKAAEKKLQNEVKDAPGLLGVYAYDDNFVRIYQDRVMFSFAEDESRYRERYLTETEFNDLKNYLAANRVDELVPFISFCEESCTEVELLMLGRQGGRRVYFRGYEKPEFFDGLDKMFGEMRKAPAKLKYELEKSIAGLEILFADENLKASAVWKDGADLRVLIGDNQMRERIEEDLLKQEADTRYDENSDYERIARINSERRAARAYDHLSWRKFVDGNLSEPTAPPVNFNFPPARDGFPVRPSDKQWKSRTANLEIRADQTGLYKISGGGIKKIRDGIYTDSLVAPDGRWAVVTKFDPEGGFGLMRVNLLNNQEFKVAVEGYGRFEPAAALPSGKKVLFRVVRYEEYYEEENGGGAVSEQDNFAPRGGEIYSLDVETGTVGKAVGEIRPLAGQTFRPLQKTSASDEFWAAIPNAKATQVGVYDLKTLTFKSLLTIPNISFESMNMWVDETERKVYFVYKGQLLALSLPKK